MTKIEMAELCDKEFCQCETKADYAKWLQKWNDKRKEFAYCGYKPSDNYLLKVRQFVSLMGTGNDELE